MKITDFDFELPHELIAQQPAEYREASRMLRVDRATGEITDDRFANFVDRLRAGDVLVLNNTKVFPARLFGRSETGASVEVFLVRQLHDNGEWEALARPAKRLHPGKQIRFDEGLSAEVVRKSADGKVVLGFEVEGGGNFHEILDRIGRTPLPPYIKRAHEIETDRERYQTVYAKNRGAIAAPTAGLHFTPAILDRVRASGVEVAEITLHVGYGTFEPVRVVDLSEHAVTPEEYEISDAAAELLNAAKSEGRRVVAVGTTTTRALEASAAESGRFSPGRSFAALTITPGYRFRAVDALLTNFHLPQSSLLVLVSTFAGHELIMKSYGHAVAERYRFYSYGDCMFIE